MHAVPQIQDNMKNCQSELLTWSVQRLIQYIDTLEQVLVAIYQATYDDEFDCAQTIRDIVVANLPSKLISELAAKGK